MCSSANRVGKIAPPVRSRVGSRFPSLFGIRAAPLDSTEASVSEDMHLVGAFSHAVGAGHVGEAERLYYAMSGENRKNADMTDSENPGSIKIWVRR